MVERVAWCHACELQPDNPGVVYKIEIKILCTADITKHKVQYDTGGSRAWPIAYATAVAPAQ